MEQSPSWEANSHSASQEISYLLRNPKLHYGVHKSPPLDAILTQMHPFHTFPPYIHQIHSNIILASKITSSEWSFPFRFCEQILYAFIVFLCVLDTHAVILLYSTTLIIFSETKKLVLSN